ncbi:Zinc finger CCCH-type [Penicillium argentinense]|uniref:Zinc finger CCCH-type n=1 Tax=Penicillium argentinense TaxID=1131581 RepID=A0A9W9KMA9_9EURO|nr:Zinc finger CCCH-type [Penicillium argentinense]KAJ5110758.1 Zinc finger CCCH-type [Penicillium argentinense]
MRGRAPLPVPSGLQNGHSRNPSSLDMARSPPNPSNKSEFPLMTVGGSRRRRNTLAHVSACRRPDTKHVPCKFFRQGACQAGPACPFLHSTDTAVDFAPCKYFSKGNCKFGAKCALAHILPDGRRVNRPNGSSIGMGSGSHLNLGGRVNPQAYVNQDSALTNSVLSQQRNSGQEPRYASQLPQQEEYTTMPGQQQQPVYDSIPTIDAGLASDAGSNYGSPIDDVRFPMSPSGRHLTALDAPLPASFDSQGISHVARYGPVAASMPSKFGLESPPAQRPGPPDAFRNLRDVGYTSGLSSGLRKPSSNIGSSPPAPEDSVGPRFLHSSRPVKPRMLSSSASVPRPSALDDWDENFPMEEDYLPMNLHDDVLTPQEKLRRLSRTDHDISSSHRDISGLGMTSSSFSKTGSPLASSPSRFGALFAKQRQKKEDESVGSSFPHIGSPLRESSLNPAASPSLGPIGSRTSHDGSSFVSSPGRQSSMSMISEQLSGMSLHPGSARHSSAGPGRLERNISSQMTPSKIEEEEQSDLVFSMEEEEGNKRNSSSWDSDTKESSTDA